MIHHIQRVASDPLDMVGPVRFELTTPSLSSVCSNQLSYEPIWGWHHSRKGCEDGEKSVVIAK